MASISRIKIDNVEYDISGSGSGHTILDEDGAAMATQSKLQFDNADVTNDATNGKTIVKPKSAFSVDGDGYISIDYDNI